MNFSSRIPAHQAYSFPSRIFRALPLTSLILTLTIAVLSNASDMMQRTLDKNDYALLTMQNLLGQDETLYEQFFESHFQKKPFHVKFKDRDDTPKEGDPDAKTDREQWETFYQDLLKDRDLDRVIKFNASSYDVDGALIYGRDVQIFRPALTPVKSSLESSDKNNENRSESFMLTHTLLKDENNKKNIVDHEQLYDLFKQGCFIRLNRMEYRSRPLQTFLQRLSHFFYVDTTSSLYFTPPDSPHIPSATLKSSTNQASSSPPPQQPIFSSHDQYILQLEGRQRISTHSIYFPHPFTYHTDNPPVLNKIYATHHNTTATETFTLNAGDVLYIPRGFAYTVKTPATIPSLGLVVSVRLEMSTVRGAIHAAVATLPSEIPFDILSDEESDEHDKVENDKGDDVEEGEKCKKDEAPRSLIPNPLDKTLSPAGIGASSLYSDLIKVGVSLITELGNGELRQYFPSSNLVENSLEESGGMNSDDLLRWRIEQFVIAGLESLLRPLIEMLGEEAGNVQNGELGLGIEGVEDEVLKDMVQWAGDVLEKEKMGETEVVRRAEKWFEKCLRFLKENGNPAEARSRVVLDRFMEKEKVEVVEGKLIERSLKRHGEVVGEVDGEQGQSCPV